MVIRPAKFSDQLRQIIQKCGISRNQICLASDIDPSHLDRFVHGLGRMKNDTIDRLAPVLGFRKSIRDVHW